MDPHAGGNSSSTIERDGTTGACRSGHSVSTCVARTMVTTEITTPHPAGRSGRKLDLRPACAPLENADRIAIADGDHRCIHAWVATNIDAVAERVPEVMDGGAVTVAPALVPLAPYEAGHRPPNGAVGELDLIPAANAAEYCHTIAPHEREDDGGQSRWCGMYSQSIDVNGLDVPGSTSRSRGLAAGRSGGRIKWTRATPHRNTRANNPPPDMGRRSDLYPPVGPSSDPEAGPIGNHRSNRVPESGTGAYIEAWNQDAQVVVVAPVTVHADRAAGATGPGSLGHQIVVLPVVTVLRIIDETIDSHANRWIIGANDLASADVDGDMRNARPFGVLEKDDVSGEKSILGHGRERCHCASQGPWNVLSKLVVDKPHESDAAESSSGAVTDVGVGVADILFGLGYHGTTGHGLGTGYTHRARSGKGGHERQRTGCHSGKQCDKQESCPHMRPP